MLPNIWFVISGFLLGASFWIDLSQRPHLLQKQQEQMKQHEHEEQQREKVMLSSRKPLSISVKTVYRSSDNKTEWCVYHYEF